MKVSIVIKTENQAFQENKNAEVLAVLESMIKKLRADLVIDSVYDGDKYSGHDSNGNKVGVLTVEEI